jgi:hypothetical protein
MKLTAEEIARRQMLHRLGEPVNKTEKHNRETWKGWQGLGSLMIYQEKVKDPKLILKIAIQVAPPPPFDISGIDLTRSFVSDPNTIIDSRKLVLNKWRQAVKELAEAGIVPQELYDEVPKHDPKKNLRAITSVIYGELGKHKQGDPDMVETAAKACVKIGDPYFAALPPKAKEGILLGALVHPLSMKSVHNHANNDPPVA